MKKVFLLFVACLNAHAQCSFEFVDNKVDGHLDKKFIQKLVSTFKVDVFFETGTCGAGTTINATPYFKTIVTAELHDGLFASARAKLAPYKHVIAFHGQSPDAIKRFAPSLNGAILFWLDAHYSGEGTALSFNNHEAPDAVTAIRGELAAIKEANIPDCVILIDDIRGFGINIAGTEYLGCWAYPSVQEVQQDLLKINPNFEFALLGDMLLAYDQCKYHPSFSKTVDACTKTRLYNGCNLNDQELLELEETIKHASSQEKEYIRTLYDRMTDYKDPMFWHDLWCGLVELGDNNYLKAHNAFAKVKIRTQSFNKNRQHEPKEIPYSHWRIDAYLNACTQK